MPALILCQRRCRCRNKAQSHVIDADQRPKYQIGPSARDEPDDRRIKNSLLAVGGRIQGDAVSDSFFRKRLQCKTIIELAVITAADSNRLEIPVSGRNIVEEAPSHNEI